MSGIGGGGEDEKKGFLWMLPELKSKRLGKFGPAFGLGAGCGFGVGIGLVGGMGFGPAFPGLRPGFGVGAGCGIGLGFGYGVGRGVAHDEYRKYSNVGKLSNGQGILSAADDIGALMDDLVVGTKKMLNAAVRDIEKWTK